jgi:hypothetical protein
MRCECNSQYERVNAKKTQHGSLLQVRAGKQSELWRNLLELELKRRATGTLELSCAD